MRKSFIFFLFFLFFCLALSGTVYAEENAAYSVLDKPVASAVQDNETVVEFFLFIAHPVMPFLRITVLIKPSAKTFPRGKNLSNIMSVFWESWGRN